jgi:hypothetical protein
MRHALTAIEAAILPRGPSLMIAPGLESASAALLYANLQIWPQRDGGERDGARMSKMRQSRSFGGEILTTP